ncbi:hypothetical protein HPB50_003271 [Hyalomma asiaticum]|uniref:Uncharacterized protein n=1 Tax=Hyalomma asiaticum TaxID=266040 RepID=A0ACB7S131_HYAAI|nr:hypothetical protein HPB50_003271 [Hyalomma asiaticum]
MAPESDPTSIALSEALEDRELATGTRVSGRGGRLISGPWRSDVSGSFEEDRIVLAATNEGRGHRGPTVCGPGGLVKPLLCWPYLRHFGVVSSE